MNINILEKIRNSRKFKIFLSILLFLIVFDKLIIISILTMYYLIRKYILKKPTKSPMYYLKRYINPEKQISYYLENLGDYTKSYSFNLIGNKENKTMFREKMSNFEPSGNIAHSLGQVFKHSGMNFKEYPNVEIKPEKPLFNDNKFLPECCFYYSQYSTDRGCPCITPDQQYYLQRRGINKHPSSFIQEDKNYKNYYFSPSMSLKGIAHPFNSLTDPSYNVYFERDPELQTDASKNEFYKLTNMISYQNQESARE